MEPGKCPHCDTPVTAITASEVAIIADSRSVRGISLNCQNCNTVLSVFIDPTILRNQIAAAVRQKGMVPTE